MSGSSFRGLPSVNELLNSPALKGMLEKVGDVNVTASVMGLMDRVRTEVQGVVNSLSASAPIAAARRYVFGSGRDLETLEQKTTINGTGVLFSSRFASSLIPAALVQSLAQAEGGYWPITLEKGQGGQRLIQMQAEARLAQFAKVDAGWLAGSFPLAIHVAFQSLGTIGDACIAACDTIELPGQQRLRDVASAAGLLVHVVGAANSTTTADFVRVLSDNPRIQSLIYVAHSPANVSPAIVRIPISEMAALAKRFGKKLVVIATDPTLIDLNPMGLLDWPSVSSLISSGGDIWILPGDRLMCGPSVGMILGNRELLGNIASSSLGLAASASSWEYYWLSLVLESAANLEKAEQEIPLINLLSTSSANLEGRASRLLPQLMATGVVASGEVVSTFASIDDNVTTSFSLPAIALSLVPAAGRTAEQLAEQLEQGAPAVLGKVADQRLLLNMKTVAAHQDMAIVEAFSRLSDVTKPA